MNAITNSSSDPNLFLVGAAKSGTTSLANYLDQHPSIFVCRPKEPNFFALPENQPPCCTGPKATEELSRLLLGHSVTDAASYRQLFAAVGAATTRIDASVRYLYSADAAQRIHERFPQAKIVAILRDPVERMHSHYHMNVRMGVEPETFSRALQLESERRQRDWDWDWHYVYVGKYAEQLRRYYQQFDREQILVLWYNDFSRDPLSVVKRVCQFAGESTEVPLSTNTRSNVGQTPRFRILRRLIWDDNIVKRLAQRCVPRAARGAVSQWVERRNRQPVPKLDQATHERLKQQFEDDRRELESLVGEAVPW